MLESRMRLLHWFRLGGRSGPVAPRIVMSSGRRVPAWSLRVGAALATLLTMPLLQPQAVGTIVVLAIVVSLLARPGGFAPVMLTLVSAFRVLTTEVFPIEVFPLLFILHLVLVLAGLAAHVSWWGHVDGTAFMVQWRRFWRVQGLAQSVALAGWWLTGIGFAAISLQLLGAMALAALVWIVIKRRAITV